MAPSSPGEEDPSELPCQDAPCGDGITNGAEECDGSPTGCAQNEVCLNDCTCGCGLTCLTGSPGGTLNPDCTCTCPNTCVNGGTLNPDCSCTCPAGYDSVHGGCFKIAMGLSDFSCVNANCNSVVGSVDGSGQFLCAYPGALGSCATSDDCPLGSACGSGSPNRCYEQCTNP